MGNAPDDRGYGAVGVRTETVAVHTCKQAARAQGKKTIGNRCNRQAQTRERGSESVDQQQRKALRNSSRRTKKGDPERASDSQRRRPVRVHRIILQGMATAGEAVSFANQTAPRIAKHAARYAGGTPSTVDTDDGTTSSHCGVHNQPWLHNRPLECCCPRSRRGQTPSHRRRHSADRVSDR